MGAGEDDEDVVKGPKSALLSSKLARARSFAPAPAPQLASTPFQRAQTTTTAMGSRTSSFLQRSVGSVRAAGGMSSGVPIASTSSAVAGPSTSTSRQGSAVPGEQEQEPVASNALADLSETGRVMFAGLKFRALGEARCANVRKAVESAGGRWMSSRDDEDADVVLVRLVSGSSLAWGETDEGERAKFRTECWLERCLFEERVFAPEEHVAFTPLRAVLPIRRAEAVVLSCSGLDEAEKCLVERLCRALGECFFACSRLKHVSERRYHRPCPSTGVLPPYDPPTLSVRRRRQGGQSARTGHPDRRYGLARLHRKHWQDPHRRGSVFTSRPRPRPPTAITASTQCRAGTGLRPVDGFTTSRDDPAQGRRKGQG